MTNTTAEAKVSQELESTVEKPFQPYVFHFRINNEDSSSRYPKLTKPSKDSSPRGGMTVVFDPELRAFAYAQCSDRDPGDVFSNHLGRTIAEGRLNKWKKQISDNKTGSARIEAIALERAPKYYAAADDEFIHNPTKHPIPCIVRTAQTLTNRQEVLSLATEIAEAARKGFVTKRAKYVANKQNIKKNESI